MPYHELTKLLQLRSSTWVYARPILLALTPARSPWATLLVSRGLGGPAAVGSMVLSAFTGVHAFAAPGRETSLYAGALFLVNAVARIVAPLGAAMLLGLVSYRTILLIGGIGGVVASVLFLLSDRTAPRKEPVQCQA